MRVSFYSQSIFNKRIEFPIPAPGFVETWIECLISWSVVTPANPRSEASKHHLASRTLVSVSQNVDFTLRIVTLFSKMTFQQEIAVKQTKRLKTRADLEQNVEICFLFTIASSPDHLAQFPPPHQKVCTLQSLTIDIFPPKTAFVKKHLF